MVDNNRRTKLLPKIILGQFGVGMLIFVISVLIIGYAQGYRFNFDNFKILKTGVFYIDYLPKDGNLSINGKGLKKYPPFAVNLTPGFYNISITKDGFAGWHENLKVESRSVNIYEDVLLFRDNITASDLADDQKIAFLNTPSDVLARNARNSLVSNGYEIWVGEKLVTRFSEPILNVSWYPDLSHIIFQEGNEIRVIDKNGKNDTLLIKMNQSGPARFTVGGKGEELYFVENGKYKVAKIR